MHLYRYIYMYMCKSIRLPLRLSILGLNSTIPFAASGLAQPAVPALDFASVYSPLAWIHSTSWLCDKYKKREILISDKLRLLGVYHICFVYQIWYNGLDSDRLCAPDRIIEKSDSLMCWLFNFFGENMFWILAFGGVSNTFRCIWVHTDATSTPQPSNSE